MGSVAMIHIPSFMKTVVLYFRVVLCVEYFIQFESHKIHYRASTLRHVSVTIFEHHQVVLTHSLSTAEGFTLYTYISCLVVLILYENLGNVKYMGLESMLGELKCCWQVMMCAREHFSGCVVAQATGNVGYDAI
jgi:hypothetical protein